MKVYATDPSFHESSTGLLAETAKLPGAKDGAREELVRLYDEFGLAYSGETLSDWVTVTTGDSIAALSARNIVSAAVPDVRGMGLRDALYLLENAGLQVKTLGAGTVRRQSIVPGAEIAGAQTITLELS